MKTIQDYTDRELLEKAAQNSKSALDAAKWVKTYIIITSLLYFVLWLFS